MKILIITQQHPQNHQKKIDKRNNIFLSRNNLYELRNY